MKLISVIFLVCLSSAIASPISLPQNELVEFQRGIFDMVLNTFGLGDVWDGIQQAGAGLASKLLQDLIKLLFKGQAAINLAKPIVLEMVQNIKDHTLTSVQAATQAINDLAELLKGDNKRNSAQLERGIFDMVLNTFGLGDVWDGIQQAGAGLASKLLQDLIKLLFKGQAAINLAKPIVLEMVQNIKDHTLTSVQAVTQAINDLAELLKGDNKRNSAQLERGFFDYILDIFSLENVWNSIENAGALLAGNLIEELTKIGLKGQAAIELAKPIVHQLVENINDQSISSVQAVTQAVNDLASLISSF